MNVTKLSKQVYLDLLKQELLDNWFVPGPDADQEWLVEHEQIRREITEAANIGTVATLCLNQGMYHEQIYHVLLRAFVDDLTFKDFL
jgi:hypothetical protein